jgi:hypothetical protein
MRRNIELIRKLLLRLESLPINDGEVYSLSPQDKEIAIEGYSLDEMKRTIYRFCGRWALSIVQARNP